MSLENVSRYYEELPNNQELKERIESITKKYTDQELAPQQLTTALETELLPIFKESGYEFTLEEFSNYHAQTKQTGALDDNELSNVVGGYTDSEGYWMTTYGYSCEHFRDYSVWPGHLYKMCCNCYYYTGNGTPDYPVNDVELAFGKTYRCLYPR